MINQVERKLFVPEKGTPIYKEWIVYSSKLADRVNLDLNFVRTCLILEAKLTPEGNVHQLLLQVYRLSLTTPHPLTRANLRRYFVNSQ
jgi:hypothetical protein